MESLKGSMAAVVLVGGVLAGSLPAAAQAVVRGPYLNQGTSTSVVVCWRTDLPTVGQVRYGPAPGQLAKAVAETAPAQEHQVTVAGLSPNTRYYYSVGTPAGVLAGNDADTFVVTSPVPGQVKDTRIWVLGDSGTKGSKQRAVRDAYYRFTGARHTDLWLMLGDNAYKSGTDAEYQQAVFESENAYPTMLRKSVLWSTLGNHDAKSASSGSQTGPYYDIFAFPKNGEAGGLPSGTEAYYAFDYANIHFVCLDSEGTDRSPAGAMARWVKEDLAATSHTWIIVFFHHPPYSKGSHDSDRDGSLVDMRETFNPILEKAGVDLVLTGHSHSYERSWLIAGHYGKSDTFTDSMKVNPGDGRGANPYTKPATAGKGTVYVVAGSSGMTSGGRLNHKAMFVSLNELGSLVLDIHGNRLDAKFLRDTGAIADSFTLIKGAKAAAK